MVQKVVGSIPISHPTAGIVQWLVCKFSKLEMRVRFSLPAPEKDKIESLLSYFILNLVLYWG